MKKSFQIKNLTLSKSLVIMLSLITFGSCQVEEDNDIVEPLNTSARQQKKTVNLSVMSYNIFQLPSTAAFFGQAGTTYKEYERSEAFNLVFQQRERVGETPDVLAIQEGFNTFFDNVIRSQTIKKIYPYRTRLLGQVCDDNVSGNCGSFATHIDARYTNGGLIIFSKYPIEKRAEHVWTDEAREYATYEGFANKGVTYAAIRKDGELFHIFNTHTNSEQPKYPATAIRKGQFNQMITFKNKLNIPASEPVIYLGDMNLENDKEKRDMESILSAKVNFTFHPDADGTYSYNNTVVKNTYHTHAVADLTYNKVLDYILYSTDHKLPEGDPRMKITYLQSHNHPYKGDLSDHNPVITDFTFTY
ncbi:sphingomyelin phosphodiesterase [Tenacibaculum ovolyticum]|uniref:sphingomyelin phosphodiesterase n=1 Tax=Tenacibaculum ovolyticum TaxID=104270 RepID=UPI003BABD7F3